MTIRDTTPIPPSIILRALHHRRLVQRLAWRILLAQLIAWGGGFFLGLWYAGAL